MILKDTWKTQILGSMKLKKMMQLWPLQICFETLSIYIHLKMGIEEFVAWFWLVLTQIKCCLFPVILTSFHRHGRRHYMSAVKMFDMKPSMLYIMIVKSLIHCCDNFEQNPRMLARCWHKNLCRHLPTDQKWPRRSPKFNKDDPWIVSKNICRSNWNAFPWLRPTFV